MRGLFDGCTFGTLFFGPNNLYSKLIRYKLFNPSIFLGDSLVCLCMQVCWLGVLNVWFALLYLFLQMDPFLASASSQ